MLRAHEIVNIWEISVGKSLSEKALLMLARYFPDTELRHLGSLPLGQRNAHLFRFREELFGTRLLATSRCPACEEGLEFELDTRIICDPALTAAAESEFSLLTENYELMYRPLNTHDLNAVLPLIEIEGAEAAEAALFQRCILQAHLAGEPTAIDTLPADILKRVSEQLRQKDPHSEILCRLTCPTCSHSWSEAFDIAKFLWHELEMKALLILQDVQALAKAFGWWEGDILSLSDARRKYYLDALHD